MRVLFWIATFVKVPQIIENCTKEFGFPISKTTVWHYINHENYQKPIARIREKWGQDILSLELAHKRRRLEELERIYVRTFEGRQYKDAMNALYQIQHEVEKDLDKLQTINNYQVNVYKDMTDAELEEERLKSLERLKLLKGARECPAEKNMSIKEVVAEPVVPPANSENEKAD